VKPENVTCPKCGGPMVSRANRKTGQRFWGCRDYPTCKGTRNTDGEAKPDSSTQTVYELDPKKWTVEDEDVSF
jgi:ssDNA-binding Zn-finger/Zn-ribbon topoisomerase 1